MPIHKNGTIRCDRKECREVVKDWYISIDKQPVYFCPRHLVQFMRMGNIKVNLTMNQPQIQQPQVIIPPSQASDGCDGIDSSCSYHPDRAAVLSEVAQ